MFTYGRMFAIAKLTYLDAPAVCGKKLYRCLSVLNLLA